MQGTAGEFRGNCGGPGVTCSRVADSHARWEAVFATEPTRQHAGVWLRRAQKDGYSAAKIEVDAKCTNGFGVYEVATARFMSKSSAAALVNKLKTKGFPDARTEHS